MVRKKSFVVPIESVTVQEPLLILQKVSAPCTCTFLFVCLLLERLGASAEENLAQQHAGQDESASKGWRHEGALRCLRSSSAQGKSMHHRCTRHANQIAMQAHHRQSQQVAHTLAHASAAVSRSAAFGAASPSLPLKDEAAAMSVCDGGGRRMWVRMTRP